MTPLPASRARTFAPGCRVCAGTGRVHVKQGLTTLSRECECWRLVQVQQAVSEASTDAFLHGTGFVQIRHDQGVDFRVERVDPKSIHLAEQPTEIRMDGLQTGNSDLVPGPAPACPYCLGKGVQQQAAPGASLMCVRCLGTGTVQS